MGGVTRVVVVGVARLVSVLGFVAGLVEVNAEGTAEVLYGFVVVSVVMAGTNMVLGADFVGMLFGMVGESLGVVVVEVEVVEGAIIVDWADFVVAMIVAVVVDAVVGEVFVGVVRGVLDVAPVVGVAVVEGVVVTEAFEDVVLGLVVVDAVVGVDFVGVVLEGVLMNIF